MVGELGSSAENRKRKIRKGVCDKKREYTSVFNKSSFHPHSRFLAPNLSPLAVIWSSPVSRAVNIFSFENEFTGDYR